MVLDSIKFDVAKTKAGANVMKVLSSKMEGYRASKKKMDSILFVAPDQDKMSVRAFSNLPFVDMLSANSLNIKDVLSKKYLILLQDAVPVIEKTYSL